MLANLNNQQQKLIALLLLLFCIVLVLGMVIVPLVEISTSYDESIDDLRFKLLRYKRTVAAKDRILEQLDKLKQRPGNENQFSNRTTPALASADLQQRIKTAVEELGGRLMSTQVVPEVEEEHLTRISIKVRMTGDIAVLRNVLYGLETARPMLIVDNLSAQPGSHRRDRITRKILPSNELNVNFDVSGYMRNIHN